MNKIQVVAGLLVATLLPFAPAHAAPPSNVLEEIVVTAQRRQENLQNVPISVTAFTGEMLERQNISSAADYLAKTPNASFSEDANFGHRGVNLSIRGVTDMKSGVNSVVNSIGIYLDEFSVVSVPTGVINPRLEDMERVEVLRGPQGTYFGRNSLGGALNLTTRSPDNKLGGEVIVENSRFDSTGAKTNTTAILNVPVSSTFAARAVFNFENSSGMVQNINPAGVGTGHRDTSGRITGVWTPSDRTKVRMTLMRTYNSQDGDEVVPSGVWNVDTVDGYRLGVSNLTEAVHPCGVGFWPGNQTQTCRDLQEYTKQGTNLAILNVSEALSSDTTLKWISGVIHEDATRRFDEDGVGEWDNFYRYMQRNGTSYSTELRVEGNKAKFNWVVGGLYADDRQQLQNYVLAGTATDAPIGPNGADPNGVVLLPPIPAGLCFSCDDKHFELSSVAIFADLTWHVSPKVDLIGGGRFTRDSVTTTLNNRGVIYPDLTVTATATGKPTFDDFSPRVGARYLVSDDLNFYGTISKGYKAGGTSLGFNADTVNVPLPAVIETPFRPETLWNYEIGMKSEWLDRRVRLNASAFYLDWKDLQLESYRFLVPGNLQSKFALTTNIDRADGKGAEVELTALITPQFTVSGSLAYLDTTIQESPPVELSGGFIVDLKGLPTPKAPPFTANLSAEYRWAAEVGNLWMRGEFVHRDGQYSNIEALVWRQTRGKYPPNGGGAAYLPATPDGFPFHTPSYDVVNVRAGWDFGGVSAEVFVDNVLNEKYYTGTAEDFSVAGIRIRPNPRIFGLRFGYKFGADNGRAK